MLYILESGSGEEKGAILIYVLSFKILLSYFCWMHFLSIVVIRCHQAKNVE
jgi:hypothetical protein